MTATEINDERDILRQSATGPPGSYPDRTHTGKQRRVRTERSPRHVTRSPPVPLGARKMRTSISTAARRTAA